MTQTCLIKKIVQEVTYKLSDYVYLMNKLLLNIYNERVKLNEASEIMHRPNNEFNVTQIDYFISIHLFCKQIDLVI